MSVSKMFVLNLMKKCWFVFGRVLASSEKNAFCQESTQLLNFDWLSVFALLILVH